MHESCVKNCNFANVYNNYAIKDIRGANVSVTGTTITNCGGGIMVSQNSGVVVSSVTLTGNTFENVDTATTAPADKAGTRAILQFASSGDYAKAALDFSSNTATNCGPVVRQLNKSAASGVKEKEEDLKKMLSEGQNLYTSDSKDAVPAGYVTDENGNVTISTAEGLWYFAEQANAGNNFAGKTVTLTENVDLGDKLWTPIGVYNDSKTHFKGTFDGQNHTVSGLNVDASRINGVGFFGKVYTGTIKNLTVEGNVTTDSCNYVGGIVGHGYATITNCTFRGTVGSTTTMQVGGIAGSGGFTVTNCSVYGDVIAECWAGGIVGNCQDGGAYTNCYVEGNISAERTYWGGGAAGITPVPLYPSQVISGCYSNTVVKVEGKEVNCPIIASYNNTLDYNGYTGDLKIYDNSWNKEKNSNDSYPIYAEKNGVGGVLIEGKNVSRDNNLIMFEAELQSVTDLNKVRIMPQSSVTPAQVEALAVAAVGDSKYISLAAAIAAAEDGNTVTLLKDATEDVMIDKNITLDLGGKTLTNAGAGKATITIAKDATATVKNGSVAGGAKYYNIQNNGTATFEGLTATAGNDGSSMIDNYGTLTITSGEYTGGLDTIKNEPNAKLTVDGGTFTLTKGASKGFTGVIFNYGELTINDGTFIQSDKSAPYGQAQVIHTDKSGSNAPSTVIKGGTFKNLCTRSTAWTVRATNAAAGATKVSGGTFNKSISEDYCADGFIPTKNADGTYGVKKGKYVATVDDTGYETLAAAVKTKINGKTVMLLDDVTENIEITKAKNFTLDLNGHTINGGTVKDKATITNYGTVTIIDSSAAKTGTIKRDDNGTVGETSYYVIRNIGTMTIEQANVTNNSGYKKTNPSGSMVGSSLICNGDDDLGGTLNISGGKIEQKNFIAIKNGALGKLNVTGGTISSDHSAIQNWFDATITGGEINGQLWTDAYIKDESVGHTTIGGSAKFTGEIVMDISGSVKPTLEISGGTLDVTNWRITTAASKAGAKPAVSGGTFSSAIPYEYCAAGYIPADKGDGKYGVKEGTYVAEVNGKQYESLQAAINAARKGETVKLLNNTKENVTIAKALTLDLNGKTLNGGQEKGKPALTVTDRIVTVKDSSEAQTGTIMREDTAENSGVSSHYVIDVQGNGWLKFESGKVTNESGIVGVKGASLVRVGDDSVAKYPGLVINGGSFRQDNFIAIKVDRGYLTLNDGTITSANSYAIENWFSATIKGGTVNGTVASWTYSGGSNSTTTITGGTINGNVNSVNYGNAEGKTAKVTISGGTVNGELDTRSYDPTTNDLTSIDDAAKATIGVTGGTFSTDPTKYVVEGSSVTTNSDGTYGVEKAYLAKVGDTSYYTMDEAFHAAVASGETLYLLRDYTTNSEQNSGSNSFTIDLNGFTWTYTGTDTNYAAFEINYPNVTLTVKNGTVVSNSMVGLIPSAMGGTITYDNSGLIFESVNATANGHSGIETNGNNTSDTVTLKNSTLNVPNGFGIYFPSSGTLTIENSQITAKTMGVQVCSGSLDIKGAETKIEVTGDGVEKTENDGAIQDGAAISIVNRAGYKGLGTITVTEGIFTAKSGNAAVKAYNWENKTASDFTASDKVAISGGTYSSEVDAALCKNGFECIGGGTTWTVQTAVKGDAELLDADGTSKGYGYADKLALTATEGQTIKLIKNTTNGGFMLPAGVTLDLNGKTMTSSFLFATGDVIDSTDGTGKLVVGQKNVLFQKHEMYLPLYDGTGYRFFQYQIVTGKLTKESPTSVKARLQLKFTNADAYTLLINDSTGAHGMALNLIISWNAIRTQDQNWRIGMPNTVLSSTLNAMRNAGVDPSERFFTLTINGVNVLGSGETLYAKAGLTNRAWPGTSEAAYGSEVSIAID